MISLIKKLLEANNYLDKTTNFEKSFLIYLQPNPVCKLFNWMPIRIRWV